MLQIEATLAIPNSQAVRSKAKTLKSSQSLEVCNYLRKKYFENIFNALNADVFLRVAILLIVQINK